MSSRNGRRSSILKSRNSIGPDAGPVELRGVQLEGGGEDGNRNNVTGALPKRVSFSHRAQVKEFEKINSSAESSIENISKTTDFNQTMMGGEDMDMSVSIINDDIENQNVPVDIAASSLWNCTKMVEQEMSVVGNTEEIEMVKSSVECSSSIKNLSKAADFNQTMRGCREIDMSVSIITNRSEVNGDVGNRNVPDIGSEFSSWNHTRIVEQDMSIIGTGTTGGIGNVSLLKSSSLPPSTNMNQTLVDLDMDMSLDSRGEEERNDPCHVDSAPPSRKSISTWNHTRVCDQDMSVVGVARDIEKTSSFAESSTKHLSKTIGFNQTRVGGQEMDMSASILMNEGEVNVEIENRNVPDFGATPSSWNSTRIVEQDMSVIGTRTTGEIGRINSSTKKSIENLSKTIAFNRTRAGGEEMDMSVSVITNRSEVNVELENRNVPDIGATSSSWNRTTRIAEQDMSMSVIGTGTTGEIENASLLMSTSLPLPQSTNMNQTLGFDMEPLPQRMQNQIQQPIQDLQFEVPDRNRYRKPIGKDGNKKQVDQPGAKFSFGVFANAKTPKRNRVLEPNTFISRWMNKRAVTTKSEGVQTSPMLGLANTIDVSTSSRSTPQRPRAEDTPTKKEKFHKEVGEVSKLNNEEIMKADQLVELPERARPSQILTLNANTEDASTSSSHPIPQRRSEGYSKEVGDVSKLDKVEETRNQSPERAQPSPILPVSTNYNDLSTSSRSTPQKPIAEDTPTKKEKFHKEVGEVFKLNNEEIVKPNQLVELPERARPSQILTLNASTEDVSPPLGPASQRHSAGETPMKETFHKEVEEVSKLNNEEIVIPDQLGEFPGRARPSPILPFLNASTEDVSPPLGPASQRHSTGEAPMKEKSHKEVGEVSKLNNEEIGKPDQLFELPERAPPSPILSLSASTEDVSPPLGPASQRHSLGEKTPMKENNESRNASFILGETVYTEYDVSVGGVTPESNRATRLESSNNFAENSFHRRSERTLDTHFQEEADIVPDNNVEVDNLQHPPTHEDSVANKSASMFSLSTIQVADMSLAQNKTISRGHGRSAGYTLMKEKLLKEIGKVTKWDSVDEIFKYKVALTDQLVELPEQEWKDISKKFQSFFGPYFIESTNIHRQMTKIANSRNPFKFQAELELAIFGKRQQ